ncbi:hypothetical protein ACQ4PT_029146 [Festuca glaucescens]
MGAIEYYSQVNGPSPRHYWQLRSGVSPPPLSPQHESPMDSNWQPVQGSNPPDGVDPSAPVPAGGDWRAQLQPEARSRIVNRILETLRRHLPVSVPEGLNELQRIAVRFEEKIYTAATSQSDYLRKVSLKMLSMETRTQQAPGNAQVIPNQNYPGQG